MRSLPDMITQRARTMAGLIAVLPAAAFIFSGQILGQTSGCTRCGSFGLAPLGAKLAEPVWRSRQEAPKREARKRERRAIARLGGSYTVCVRTCDGSFFPVSYTSVASRADGLEAVCRSLCPNADMALFSFPFGGTIEQARSSTGEPYANLPNAGKFQQTYDPRCSCRGEGQSWMDALASAEARYGHRAGDILVTAEKSVQMSQPNQGSRTISAEAMTIKDDVKMKLEGLASPASVLDGDGVDAQLRAAAAKIGHQTSGITDNLPSDASYTLNQGQIVEVTNPDGSMRRVRVVAPIY
jgi:Protein of unknown function (DUF2865)